MRGAGTAVDVVERRMRRRRARAVIAMRARVERGDRRWRCAQGGELARHRPASGTPRVGMPTSTTLSSAG